ncbi:hypothetical protein [Mycobacterium syngnathidarum]
MANDDHDGQRWAKELVKRVGKAIKDVRGTKSAAWLSDRTAELGFRVSPTVIAKLDSGHRGSVLSVPELIVLAAALNTSPVNLVYPGPYESPVEILPNRENGELSAAEWFSGVYSYLGHDGVGAPEDPAEQWQANTETLRQWRYLDELFITKEQMDDPKHIAVLDRQIKATCDRLGIKLPPDEVFGRDTIELKTGDDDA